jgi:hypothetical protein
LKLQHAKSVGAEVIAHVAIEREDQIRFDLIFQTIAP